MPARLTPAAQYPDLLILQGSSFCNIDCRYCYVLGREDRARMSPAVLDAVAANILASPHCPDTVDVAWHAGEPLALPSSWLDAACERLVAEARPGQRLRFGVQTNAMLIDEAWIDVIRRHRITIGVSIDGPRDLHDAARRDRRGKGTFDRAMAGVERLKEAGIAFDVIAVLTRAALGDAERMFAFFEGLGPRSLGFNIEEIEGPNTQSTLQAEGTPAAFAAFLERFLACHRAAGEPFTLRALDMVTAPGVSADRAFNDQKRPFSILTVGVDGSLSTYSPELLGAKDERFADFVFGNVLSGGPEQMAGHPAFQAASADIAEGIDRCRRTCGYFGVCGGGAPANKYFEHGTFAADETLYCELAIKQTVEAALAHLEAARLAGGARRWRGRRSAGSAVPAQGRNV